MIEQRSPAELAAEASSEDTRSFVRRVKRATRRKYTPEEKVRVVLEMADLAPEEAARVSVNGAYAGGLIAKPLRLDVTKHVKPGANTVEIVPLAPKSARLAIYPR